MIRLFCLDQCVCRASSSTRARKAAAFFWEATFQRWPYNTCMKTQLMTTAALAALAGPSLAQCEVQELVPVGLTPWYGYAVAVAGDVAAVSDPSGADGRVHVFERGATSWEYVVACARRLAR